jgi:hypothetical protein
MTAKYFENFFYKYNRASGKVDALYGGGDSVKVIKFNSSYYDDGRYEINEIYIETCHFPNLKKLVVPKNVKIYGEHNLPYGCVIERY